MKLLLFILALTLAEKAFSIHLETCECHEIRDLVNATVQEAVAELENKLRQVNSSVQAAVAGLERTNNLIHSSINSTENKALDALEVKLITTIEKLIQPIQNQLYYLLPPPGPLQNSRQHPAISCNDLYWKHPLTPSGYYWIRQSGQPAVRVYCSMNRTCGDERGGWMRVADLDMTNTSHFCPTGLAFKAYPKRLCTSLRRCASGYFSTKGIQYSHVCGKVIGYQERGPVAFTNRRFSIEHDYVNGVSLTHGHPRKHIWTFAGARDESNTFTSHRCSCMLNKPLSVPSYVGEDYFCDTAIRNSSIRHSGVDIVDPLWDGKGCGTTSTCCSFNSPPWFVKELPSPTTDDIELRVCYPYNNGNTPIEIVKLYVQ